MVTLKQEGYEEELVYERVIRNVLFVLHEEHRLSLQNTHTHQHPGPVCVFESVWLVELDYVASDTLPFTFHTLPLPNTKLPNSISPALHFFFVLGLKFYLFVEFGEAGVGRVERKRERDRQRERDLYMHSSKSCNSQRWIRLKPRASCWGPSTWTTPHCFPRHIFREVERNWSSQDPNWHLYGILVLQAMT